LSNWLIQADQVCGFANPLDWIEKGNPLIQEGFNSHQSQDVVAPGD